MRGGGGVVCTLELVWFGAPRTVFIGLQGGRREEQEQEQEEIWPVCSCFICCL